MSSTLSKAGKAAVSQNQSNAGTNDAKNNKNLLERVQAFANLRFPPVITALQKESDPEEIEAVQMEQMLDLVIFFMGEIKDDDAIEFIQAQFQHMHRKKLAKQGVNLPPVDDEPDWLRLIRFKPTHEAFHNLQDSYVDGRLHLTQLLEKGK